MRTAQSAFAENGFVHVTDFVDQTTCKNFVSELNTIVSAGESHTDSMCPSTPSISGQPLLDNMLEELLPHIQTITGKTLLPTYAYARIYGKGDELEPHTDRPACEISATIMLGSDGTPWPIQMADFADPKLTCMPASGETPELKNVASVKMKPGDAVVYKGPDKVHWREKFTGEWHTQVFLHYVDANGPHAEWKYDKRRGLSHHASPDYYWWHYPDILTKEACQKLIESLEAKFECQEAQIGDGNSGVVNKEVRDVRCVTLPSYRGIGATMVGIGMDANQQVWNFDVTGSKQTDYLKYDKNGHYKAHVDTFMNPGDQQTRKLTVLLFLNDDFEGGRLFLQHGPKKIYPPQGAGTALVFPSYTLHGVEPVTSGIRRSIVTWLVGPWFK